MTILVISLWGELKEESNYFWFFIQFYLSLLVIYIFGIIITLGIYERPLRDSMGLIGAKLMLRPILQVINFIMMLTVYDATDFYS